MTDADRIYQLMLLTARSDGHVDPRETSTAIRLLREIPELHEVKGRNRLARAAGRLLRRRGLIGAVQELAIPIAPALHRVAIECCAQVLAADGVIAGPELEVMGQLRRTFGLSAGEVERVIAASARAPLLEE